jgi:hypothetical protein
MKTSAWWMGAVAIACVIGCDRQTGSGAAPSQPVRVEGAAANAANALQARDGEKPQPTIEFGTVTISRNNPGAIDPCVHVIRGIYQASQSGAGFEADFTLTYTSGGKTVTKSATVPLSRMHAVEEHPPEVAKFVNLHTDVDVSSDPPDAGTTITGTVKLMKSHDGARVLEAEARTQS